MAGIRALFTASTVRNAIADFEKEAEDRILITLQFLGEEFVNKARTNRTYTDRTGNLRASIGYIILKDGSTIERNFEGRNRGKVQGSSFAQEIGSRYKTGWALIGVAGMEYAAYVEAKGFDVITGSAPSESEIKNTFNEINS